MDETKPVEGTLYSDAFEATATKRDPAFFGEETPAPEESSETPSEEVAEESKEGVE